MKISNKEKIMLFILGIILIGIVYYNFVYSVQISQIEDKAEKLSEIKQKYDTSMEIINSIEDKKNDVKILKGKIIEEAKPFYPTISQEHIILEIDDLLKANGLDGGIKFSPIASDNVEGAKRENKILADSSFQEYLEQYNDEIDTKENDTKSKKEKQSSNEDTNISNKDQTSSNVNNTDTSKSNSSKTSATDNSNGNNSNDKKKNTIHYVKFTVNFKGSYEGLTKLLNSIRENKSEKKIVVNSIKIDSDTISAVKGTMDLEVYAIPKIDDDLQKYLRWDLNNAYGKNVPFNTGAAGGITKENKDISDFKVSVKSSASDLPTIMMSRSNDILRTTYVYASSNSKENAEMVIAQDGDKYYYKYKTTKGKFPTSYDGLGAEFVPASQNIVLDVLSDSRISSNDNSGLKLKIINKTDKLVQVNISGDDASNSRVTIDGDSSNISVNKK